MTSTVAALVLYIHPGGWPCFSQAYPPTRTRTHLPMSELHPWLLIPSSSAWRKCRYACQQGCIDINPDMDNLSRPYLENNIPRRGLMLTSRARSFTTSQTSYSLPATSGQRTSKVFFLLVILLYGYYFVWYLNVHREYHDFHDLPYSPKSRLRFMTSNFAGAEEAAP
ncbi:hypothetical protein F4778DRAFT_169979 [Xylariomycetidae sp. FL2044]|nr:hypothetical protein F4778DRAFT_169979 [Xylariomycetidae sp. FL2044]